MYSDLAMMAAFVFVYSIIAGRVEKMPLSGPIVFTLFGVAFGPLGLDLLSFHADGETLKSLAELTLALVLFTDAAGTDLVVLKKNQQLPIRLLLIGLPLTVMLGFVVGDFLFPGLTLFEIAILAAMLAPTDAALGSAVVTNPKVPNNIRQALNVESGLNDGICVPIVLLFLTLATGEAFVGGDTELALRLVSEEIGIGVAVGLILTGCAAVAVRACGRRGWIGDAWRQMIVMAIAFSCFALAQELGGSGFIASFVGGLLFGALAKEQKYALLETSEGIGNLLALATWVMFGCAVVGQMSSSFNWQIVMYAVLSLTVIRMLPVFLTLWGTGLKTGDKLFMGWFGPRGLASIVFIVIVNDKALPGNETLVLVVVCTVFLSILAHGFTANPLVARLAARQ